MTRTSRVTDCIITKRNLYLTIALLLLGLLTFNLVLSWVLQVYFGESALNMIPVTAADPSWIPAGTHFTPALGNHYFGDFEVYSAYARSTSSAYYPQVSGFFLPAAYGPFTIVFAKLFNVIFRWPMEVFVYLLLSLLLFAVGIYRLLGRSVESLIVVMLLMLSAPVIMSLDRGNFTLLVLGLCCAFCIGVLEKRPGLTIVSLTLACAFKAYAAVLLLVLIKNRRWRELSTIIVASVVLTTVCFLVLPGSFVGNVRGFLSADFSFNSSVSTSIGDSVGIAAVIYKFVLLASGPAGATHFVHAVPGLLTQLPGIAVAVSCLAIIMLSGGVVELELLAALMILQLVPIDADANLELTIVVGLCLLLRLLSQRNIYEPRARVEGRRESATAVAVRGPIGAAAVLLAIGSVPWFFRFGTTPSIETEAWLIFGPIASILAIGLLLVDRVHAYRRLRLISD